MNDSGKTIQSDESAIEAILDAQQNAWNAGDGIAWGIPYVEDAGFVNILGEDIQGRSAMVERHVRIFAGPFRGSQVVITLRKVTRPAANVAVIDTTHEVSNFAFLPQGIVPTSEGTLKTLMKYIAVRRDSAWMIVAAHNTAIMPLPAMPTLRPIAGTR